MILPISDPDAIPRAVAALERGELVVLPTDTVYGVAAAAFDSAAIDRLYAAKQRPAEKAIPVLLADVESARRVASDIPPLAARFAAHFWPGPLTITLPKREGLPPNLSAYPTIAARMPDHSGCRAVIRAAGEVLAVTSANRSGGPNPTTVHEAVGQLGDTVAIYLDGGTTPGPVASTVVAVAGETFRVLRSGPVTEAMLARVAESAGG